MKNLLTVRIVKRSSGNLTHGKDTREIFITRILSKLSIVTKSLISHFCVNSDEKNSLYFATSIDQALQIKPMI